MNRLLKGILISLPFMTYFFIGKSILTSQAVLSILAEIVIILLFIMGIWNKRNPDLKAPVILLAYMILSAGFVIVNRMFIDEGMSGLLRPLLHISIFFLFYFALCYILNEKTYEDVLKVAVYPAVILSAICLYQKFGIDMFKYNQTWVNGTLGNPTNNAMYLCACLPFAFLHKRPFIIVAFLFLGMFVCWSTSAILASIIIIFIYLLAKKKYLWSTVFLFVLAIIAFLLKDKMADFFNPYEKLAVWQKAIEEWKSHYILGWGLDNFKNLHFTINTSSYSFTHNHYIWILYSCGLVGLVLFLNWFRSLRFVFNPADVRFLATLSLIGVAIMACVSVPMRVYSIVILTAFNIAILTKEKKT